MVRRSVDAVAAFQSAPQVYRHAAATLSTILQLAALLDRHWLRGGLVSR